MAEIASRRARRLAARQIRGGGCANDRCQLAPLIAAAAVLTLAAELSLPWSLPVTMHAPTTAVEDRNFKRCFSGPWPGCVGHLGLAGQQTE